MESGEAATFVSVLEYLSMSAEPDCEYVDGVLLERHVGEKDHNKIQKKLLVYFGAREKDWNIFVIQEQRIRISPTRFRIPDLCIYLGPEPEEQVFTKPPFLCIEILSPEDRMSRMLEKIRDFLAFGVSYVWVVDPQARVAEVYTASGSQFVTEGVLKTSRPEISISLSELFE
jgi:Uma2 family endonuclease